MISYYLARPGSTQEGPFSEDELKGLYHQRTLPPGSYVWTEGWDQWRSCEDAFEWFISSAKLLPLPPQSDSGEELKKLYQDRKLPPDSLVWTTAYSEDGLTTTVTTPAGATLVTELTPTAASCTSTARTARNPPLLRSRRQLSEGNRLSG